VNDRTRHAVTATSLLWSGAGRPAPEGAEPYDGPCWWCGEPSPGTGRPVADAVPDTFPDRARALSPAATHLCAACAWTMSDRIALPAELADAGLAKRIAEGGRLRVSVRGDDPKKPRLFLRLDDGRIGVWLVGRNAAADEPWLQARASLRSRTEDVGENRLLDVITDADLSAGATARFRNYHHLGTPTRWRPCTAADRALLRVWLLDPPESEPWVCVIGDGQKHAAIHASDAVVQPGDLCAVYLEGAIVRYDPPGLRWRLDAIERLRLAGASDDEIRTGRYARSGLEWARAWREYGPTAADTRKRPALMDLCLFLRRLPKEMPNV
jgi:hypothetical protein